ncbi:uroporphyrinogen synthase [Trichoderma citrinoviride]|uniref:Uroporphyrinogen synthase n=1 Tax=Trichoderma citrinoviride TaxID=58853 RepID=A0A2T4AZQ1_9HYPO|nr:uroporphyrinogen synthase [Trichoderma citrinoviride]PTB62468.1 uroporphyrinogen synthase [Trichoderma citrinoviride]
MASLPSSTQPVPVLLLKTRSSPSDAYEDLLSSPANTPSFAPTFVPVLQHKFEEKGINRLRDLLRRKRIGTTPDCDFGGLIFTSQRAVEAFSHVVREDEASKDPSWPHLQHIPIYSVGPATTRALAAVPQDPPLQIFGSHTGNGDALAQFILDHYAQCNNSSNNNNQRLLPPLLFLVGEQRRDIIPRTLTDPSLPPDRRIPVTEEVVYGTGEMPSFPADFASVLDETTRRSASSERWIVVFSPTGCDSMLRGLDLLDPSTGKFAGERRRQDGTFVATIGPTTRNHLVNTFGFEPDVCAETPTPEGVLEGILAFQKKRPEKTT